MPKVKITARGHMSNCRFEITQNLSKFKRKKTTSIMSECVIRKSKVPAISQGSEVNLYHLDYTKPP